jgi:hypothetical protein
MNPVLSIVVKQFKIGCAPVNTHNDQIQKQGFLICL